MPRSLERRIESLEQRRRSTKGDRPVDLYERFRYWAEAGTEAFPGFIHLWRTYAAERDRVWVSEEATAVPPENYRPDLPKLDRVRRWLAWDQPSNHRQLDSMINNLLRRFVDHAKEAAKVVAGQATG